MSGTDSASGDTPQRTGKVLRQLCLRRSAAGFILRHTDVSGLFREADYLPQVFLRHSPQIAEKAKFLSLIAIAQHLLYVLSN